MSTTKKSTRAGVSKGGARKIAAETASLAEGRMAALSAATANSSPNKPVKVTVLEAERLAAALGRHRKALLALPGFEAEDLQALPELIVALEKTERSWSRLRLAQGESSLVAARKEAEIWRREATAAARYLLRRDTAALAELERIAQGEGLADLVHDLDDLARLLRQHAAVFAALPNAPDPKEGRRLSTLLRRGRDDSDAERALGQRNRAFWALDAVVEEVRAALRFVLRDDPKKLTPLLSRYQADRRAKQRRRASSSSNGAVAAPVHDGAPS